MDGNAVQSTAALSSGESIYHARLRSSAHALGIKATLNDWHYDVKREIPTAARQETCLLGKGCGKLDTLTCVSCGHNKRCRTDVLKCSVSRQARLCQTHSRKSISVAVGA